MPKGPDLKEGFKRERRWRTKAAKPSAGEMRSDCMHKGCHGAQSRKAKGSKEAVQWARQEEGEGHGRGVGSEMRNE